MQSPLPLTRDLVLIGGGHTHALVMRRWAMNPVAGVRLTLINPAPTAAYSGMLPGYVAGHYTRKQLEIDLVRLARFAGARLILAPAIGLDRDAQRVCIRGQADVFYDLASIDIGITSELPTIPGFREHALGAKPLATFASAWEHYLARVCAGAPTASAQVVIIGGGIAGVELALAMMHRLRAQGVSAPGVTVLDSAPDILRGVGAGARRALLAHLQKLGVALKTGVTVSEVRADSVLLSDATTLPATFCVAAATARPHDWLRDTGLDLQKGFVTVDATLRAPNDPAIYTCGDCAHLSQSPRPKAGVFAVREAPVLYHNLRAEVMGGHRRPYRPQRSYLKLISTGGKGAVADKAGLRLDGRLLWRWKDHIDRKFMRQFQDLPPMPGPEMPRDVALGVRAELGIAPGLKDAALPLCGGCGAKVGGDALGSVLARLAPPTRKDVLSRPGDDAAVLRCGSGEQVFTTDHLRAFTNDPYRMARIAAVHALGDVWAMGATPQAALVSVVLPRMSAKLQAETLREIMAAAAQTFTAAGADVVGGHTSLGAEMTLGFSVTGLIEASKRPAAIRVDGAQVGDALILTKAIGTGTILAGEMRLLARGDWVAQCYQAMEHPSAQAAAILAPVAHAMTDVTGFGLAGHCNTMMQASGTHARLVLADVPLLEGAEDLAAEGVRSSLWQANRDALAALDIPDSPRAGLLFDPQTAGGLLASVPAEKAGACLEALHAAGEEAAIIGTLVPGPVGLRVI